MKNLTWSTMVDGLSPYIVWSSLILLLSSLDILSHLLLHACTNLLTVNPAFFETLSQSLWLWFVHMYQQLLLVIGCPSWLLKGCRLNIGPGVTRSGLLGAWSNKCRSRQRHRWKNGRIISISIRKVIVGVKKFGGIRQRDIGIEITRDIGIDITGTKIWPWLVLKSVTLLRKGMMSQRGVWRSRILHVNVLKRRRSSKYRFGYLKVRTGIVVICVIR